jgi:hypothetical protein
VITFIVGVSSDRAIAKRLGCLPLMWWTALSPALRRHIAPAISVAANVRLWHLADIPACVGLCPLLALSRHPGLCRAMSAFAPKKPIIQMRCALLNLQVS